MAEPDDDLLLGAHLDGELSAGETIALEHRLATEPRLAARLQRLEALSAHVRRHLERPALPPALEKRVAALARPAPRRRFVPAALAASWLVAAALGAGGALLSVERAPGDPREDMALASHVRALMAPQAVDVASSDQHTVKPWFAGRVTLAPRVVDLSADGIALLGGRVDVIGRAVSPTLVYQQRRHAISLLALAEPGASAPPATRQSDGHTLVSWAEQGVRYLAVSDLGADDLERFVRLYRAGTPSP